MIFDHEAAPTSAVRSKSTGRLYPSIGDLVQEEGAQLLGAILYQAGIEATESEARRLWLRRAELLALCEQARAVTEEARLYAAIDAADLPTAKPTEP